MANLQKVKDTLKKRKGSLIGKPNVVGVAVGHKMKGGVKTDELAMVVFVKSKVQSAKLKASERIPQSIDGIKTDVVETGEIVAQDDPKGRFRPSPGGVSVGHRAITAGTLGKWVKYGGEYHILSNNHVLANSNTGMIDDAILQPGNYDGGVNPDDKIAELSTFIDINFNGGDNLVDAALAKVLGGSGVLPPDPPEKPSTCSVAGSVVGAANFVAKTFGRETRLKAIIPVKAQAVEDYVDDTIHNIGSPTGIIEGEAGMIIMKMGRTTGLTRGEILYVDATVNVGYGSSGTATFVDQIIAGNMSAGGDSGSIIVTEDGKNIVGLLFAGSVTHTIINRIQNVIDAFPGMEVI